MVDSASISLPRLTLSDSWATTLGWFDIRRLTARDCNRDCCGAGKMGRLVVQSHCIAVACIATVVVHVECAHTNDERRRSGGSGDGHQTNHQRPRSRSRVCIRIRLSRAMAHCHCHRCRCWSAWPHHACHRHRHRRRMRPLFRRCPVPTPTPRVQCGRVALPGGGGGVRVGAAALLVPRLLRCE